MEEFELTNDQQEQQELYEHYKFIVDKGQSPLRIDKYLINRIENVSRNRIQNAIKAGNIIVNEKIVKSNYKVKPGDIISVVLPYPPIAPELIPENIPIDIIYEDDDVVVINKKPDMVVHPGCGNYSGTLVNALLYHFKENPLFSKNEIRPGLVHRLDKGTSGLLVVAKNEIAMNKLAMQFFQRTVKRKYIALIWGNLKNDEGTIIGHIGRSLKDRKKMDVFEDGSYGKPAITHYKVLERLYYVTLVECRLETGRTHQIRVHMAHIGHPVFNDDRYGGNKILKGTINASYRQFIENCFEIMPRPALHAKVLGFIHPSTEKEMYFETSLPEDFQEVLNRWRNYINNNIK